MAPAGLKPRIALRHGDPALSLPNDYVRPLVQVAGQLGRTQIRHVHPWLKPGCIEHGQVAIGAARDDIGPAYGLFRAGDGLDLDIQLTAHLRRVYLPVSLVGAVDPNGVDVADTREGLEIGPRHTA